MFFFCLTVLQTENQTAFFPQSTVLILKQAHIMTEMSNCCVGGGIFSNVFKLSVCSGGRNTEGFQDQALYGAGYFLTFRQTIALAWACCWAERPVLAITLYVMLSMLLLLSTYQKRTQRKIPQNVFPNIVKRYRKILRTVIRARGVCTKY